MKSLHFNYHKSSLSSSTLLAKSLLLFWLLLGSINAANKTYNWPTDLASNPFNCTGFNCGGIDFGNDIVTININSAMTVNISGNFKAKNNLTFNNNGHEVNLNIGGSFQTENHFKSDATLNLIVSGNIKINNHLSFVGDMTAGGNIQIDDDAKITGDLTAGGNIQIDDNAKITGDLMAGGNIELGNNSVVHGSCIDSDNSDNGDEFGKCGGAAPSAATLRAEYRFDECGWSGIDAEVVDSRSSYHAKAIGATTSDVGSKVGRHADLSATGVDDYLLLPSGLLHGVNDFTFSVWIKTSVSKSEQEIIHALGSGANDDEFQLYIEHRNRLQLSILDTKKRLKIVNVADGMWHHIVVTRKGSKVKAYVDGRERDDDTFGSGALSVADGGVIVGQEQDAIGGSFDSAQAFDGMMDEMLIYEGALSALEVKTLYDYQKSGKNPDGTARAPVQCRPVPVADYHMDACDVSDFTWTLDSSGNGYTAIFGDEKLSLQEGRICSGVEILREDSISEVNAFKPGISTSALGDEGTIMFWYRSNQAWSSNPGKMLVDATKGDKYFFLGLRSNGQLQLYLEDQKDGDFQSFSQSTYAFGAGEWVHCAISWDYAAKSFRLYINGANAPLMLLNNSAGGSGRHIPPNLNELFIGDISENYTQNPNLYDGVRNSADGRFDEVKLFDEVLDVAKIAAVFSAETAGRDYGSGALRVCEPCVYESHYRGFFDAWDLDRSLPDRNISTKIVAQTFSLTIASLDEPQQHLQEFNGTVCARVVDAAQVAHSPWVKSLFVEQNSSVATFRVDRALKEARVELKWQRDADVACRAMVEDNATLSSDDFAVRPLGFTLQPTGPYYALETFSVMAHANDAAGRAVSDYNETQNVSFRFDMNETRSDCIVAGESGAIQPMQFQNGALGPLDANYSGLAYDLALRLYEINGSEFARIDRDDTPDAVRFISEDEVRISVVPYEISVTQTDINASTQSDWLYMADLHEMNATLHVSVQANDKAHRSLRDFNASCYSQNVEVAFDVDVQNGDAALDMNYSAIEGTLMDVGTTLGDIDKRLMIGASQFIDGNASASYALNVDRNFSVPIPPFRISGLAASIVSANSAKVLNNDSDKDDGVLSFYYGRLKTRDLKATVQAQQRLEIEVYRRDDLGASGWQQNSLEWYRNEAHTGDLFGRIHAHSVEQTMQLSGVSDAQVTLTLPQAAAGVIDAELATTRIEPFSRTVHLNVDPWLWYAPKDFGGAFSYAVGSSCMQHPCFNYTFWRIATPSQISSGTFSGSDFNTSQRQEELRQGVKVFR